MTRICAQICGDIRSKKNDTNLFIKELCYFTPKRGIKDVGCAFVVVRLGGDVERVTKTVKGVRNDPRKWIDGKFVHPHDACFDHDGNILVAEWVATGRVTRLRRLS